MSTGLKISELGLVTSLAVEDLFVNVDISTNQNVRYTYASLVSQLTNDLTFGNLNYTGSPLSNQIPVFSSVNEVAGSSNLTWDGSNLESTQFNGVALTTSGSISNFLNEQGNYIAVSGLGDVIKVGTPVNNQLGIWTGDGTIEGDSNITWDGTTLSATEFSGNSFNGISLTTGGSATNFLNEQGNYVTTSGGGDVVKVGTPANNQLGVWTGDGTIEGDSNITWDGAKLHQLGTSIVEGLSESTGASEYGRYTARSDAGSIFMVAYGSTRAGNQVGTTLAGKTSLFSNQPIIFYTSSSDDIIIGTGDTLSATVDGVNQDWSFSSDLISLNDFYIGEKSTNGSWRFTVSGDDLLIQQREAGIYNTKSTISGA